MNKKQLNEWVHQLVNESEYKVVKEIQLGEATVRLSTSTDANFHNNIVQLVSNNGAVGLDKKDMRALLGYIKKMMGYSYMPRLKEGKLTEDKFIAFYKNDRVTINANSLWDAKKQIIAKLKVPKKDVGLVSVLNKTEYDKQKFRFEGKLEEKLNEGDIDKKVDTKIVAQRVLKDFKGQYTWVGKAWVKELLKKYPKGISQTDFIIDAENLKNTFGGHIGGDRMFKGLNEQKLNERVVSLPSGIKADLDTLKGLTIFTLKGKPIKFDRQQLAMFLRAVGKHMGIK